MTLDKLLTKLVGTGRDIWRLGSLHRLEYGSGLWVRTTPSLEGNEASAGTLDRSSLIGFKRVI